MGQINRGDIGRRSSKSNAGDFGGFVKCLRQHPRLLIAALSALAAAIVGILFAPSPGNTMAVILLALAASATAGTLLYVFMDERLSWRKEQLRALGTPRTSSEIVRALIRRHRVTFLACVVIVALVMAIALLAANAIFTPIGWLLLCLLLLILIACGSFAIVASQARLRLMKFGACAPGTIVDKREIHGVTGASMESGSDFVDKYWVTYEFSPKEGVDLRQEQEVGERKWGVLRLGSRVVVAFDPRDPTQNLMVG
jgi:hypothetical protein